MRRAANNRHTVADVEAHLDRLGVKDDPIDAEIILHNRRGPAAREAALWFQQSTRYADVMIDEIDRLRGAEALLLEVLQSDTEQRFGDPQMYLVLPEGFQERAIGWVKEHHPEILARLIAEAEEAEEVTP